MARQMKGKEAKETNAQRRARKARNLESQAQATKVALPALGASFLVIFLFVIWATRK